MKACFQNIPETAGPKLNGRWVELLSKVFFVALKKSEMFEATYVLRIHKKKRYVFLQANKN
jgi:hypothetical protein